MKQKERSGLVGTKDKDIKRQVADFNKLMKKLKLTRTVEMEILKFGIRNEFQSPVAATKVYIIERYIPDLLKQLLFL